MSQEIEYAKHWTGRRLESRQDNSGVPKPNYHARGYPRPDSTQYDERSGTYTNIHNPGSARKYGPDKQGESR